jgi:hypothetical protein
MSRLTFMSFVLACVVSAAAQNAQRDPSAMGFLTQAVSAAGGSGSISAVQDFTAQGTITHYWDDSPEQGQLTVKSLGPSQFRIDSAVSEGTWSSITNNSLGEISLPDGTTVSLPPHNLLNNGNLTLPIVKVNAALLDQTQSIVDMGLVQFGSGQARQIGIQQNLQNDPTRALSKLTRMDYFFDSSSFLLLRVRYVVHPNTDMTVGANRVVLDFGSYQNVNGIVAPFSIKQAIAGQQIWAMQLSSLAFNTGLSDSDFQF